MKDPEPNPFSDVRQGLSLLFRAARTAARKLPKTDLEEAVATSAREVGRAIENVAATIEREVFGKGNAPSPRRDVAPEDSKDAPAKPGSTGEPPKPV